MTRTCRKTAVATFDAGRAAGSVRAPSSDELSVYAPLEIRPRGHDAGGAPTPTSATMRTPGDDEEADDLSAFPNPAPSCREARCPEVR